MKEILIFPLRMLLGLLKLGLFVLLAIPAMLLSMGGNDWLADIVVDLIR